MTRVLPALIIVTATLALWAESVFAQVEPQQSVQLITTLEQAVRVAEEATGGTASEAKVKLEDGAYVYKIETLSTDRSAKVYVDFMSGQVLRIDDPGLFERIGNLVDPEGVQKKQAELAVLQASPMALVGAIAAAESQHGGRAVEAKTKINYGVLGFEVALVKDLSKQKVAVDSTTGNVTVLLEKKKKKKKGRH